MLDGLDGNYDVLVVARSTEETPIEVGVTVEVISIEGVAALVRPVDGS